MKTLTKLLSGLLILCILLLSASCEQTASTEGTTEGISESLTETEAPVSFELTEKFILICPELADPVEFEAVQLLSRGIRSAFGFYCEMTTDFTRKGAEVQPNEFEILVGRTNRNESRELFVELPYYDYTYEVVNENVIAICGGSPEATYTAVESFLLQLFGYQEDPETREVLSAGAAATLTVGTAELFEAEYPVSSLKIGTRDFSEYSLVVTDETLSSISTVIGAFSRLCGQNLPVVPLEEYTSGPAIFFGCAKPDGSHYEISMYNPTRYFIVESGENIFIDFKNSGASERAAERFLIEYLPKTAEGSATVHLKGADSIFTALNITNGTNGLVLTETDSQTLANGVYYTAQLYTDKNGAPVRAYAVTIKNGAASITTSLPTSGVGYVTSVKNMLKNERAEGKNAIVSINADFFDMGGTNVMRGLCIKDGQVLHSVGEHPWFGITKDGKAVMGVSSEYDTYAGKLQNAVGGSHILLRKDNTDNLGIGSDFGDTRHPRTAVGVTSSGDIVLLVVDGRQPSVSNGASLADLAFILSSFGCSDGINLDGGGSSTFVLSDANGVLSVMNSPSAGALRAVANGLTVILSETDGEK